MSKEIQTRAFTTVLGTTKAKGTGLGLAIVGRIIETHRGQIADFTAPRPRNDPAHHPAGEVKIRRAELRDA